MEARAIAGAVTFSIWKGRATRQTELNEPFIVWPTLRWVKAPLFAKVPKDKEE